MTGPCLTSLVMEVNYVLPYARYPVTGEKSSWPG